MFISELFNNNTTNIASNLPTMETNKESTNKTIIGLKILPKTEKAGTILVP